MELNLTSDQIVAHLEGVLADRRAEWAACKDSIERERLEEVITDVDRALEQCKALIRTDATTIDPQAVEQVLIQSLSDGVTGVIVEGITGTFMLNLEALTQHREAVRGWVEQLPEEFLRGKGEGYTFLAMGQDRNGVQWTGLHRMMELLYVLAAGLGMAKFCLPRDVWSAMPGGVPYIVLDPEGGL